MSFVKDLFGGSSMPPVQPLPAAPPPPPTAVDPNVIQAKQASAARAALAGTALGSSTGVDTVANTAKKTALGA